MSPNVYLLLWPGVKIGWQFHLCELEQISGISKTVKLCKSYQLKVIILNLPKDDLGVWHKPAYVEWQLPGHEAHGSPLVYTFVPIRFPAFA